MRYKYVFLLGRPGCGKSALHRALEQRILERRQAKTVRPWVLGLGSWDPECEKKGQRYTICIEETEHTDFFPLATERPLSTKQIGVSNWMCAELTASQSPSSSGATIPTR